MILKVSEIEETSRTTKRLDCYGIARLNNGGEEGIVFHIEEDADGDFFYGYEAGSKPIQRAHTPTPTLVQARPPLPETATPAAPATPDTRPTISPTDSLPTEFPTPTQLPTKTLTVSPTLEALRSTLTASIGATPSAPLNIPSATASVDSTKPPQAIVPCCISIGSTRDEVLSILGKPDSDYDWGDTLESTWYGYSTAINFGANDERVVSWIYTGLISDSPFAVLDSISSVPLSNPGGLTSIGSTADEVFGVLGEPDQVWHWGRGQEISWSYYNASVSFDTNGERVTDWYYDGPLQESPFR